MLLFARGHAAVTTLPQRATDEPEAAEAVAAAFGAAQARTAIAVAGMLSLLALHAAPPAALLPLLQSAAGHAQPPAAAGVSEGDAEGAAWVDDATLEAVRLSAAIDDACARMQVRALAPAQPPRACARLDPLAEHAGLQAAAEAPWPPVKADELPDWPALLATDSFPLASAPALVLRAARRRADAAAAAEAGGAAATEPPPAEVAEMLHLLG